MCLDRPLLANVNDTALLKCDSISFYLKEQDELWKSLNRFHHQAIQSHPVIICLLTMLFGGRCDRISLQC